jgi:hypothetical protein
MTDGRKHLNPTTTIVISAIIAHGLLLLNDGIYWDGWLIYSHLVDKAWNNLFLIFQEAGSPQTAYFHWGFSYFNNIIFGYKAVVFLSITISTILIYRILGESGLFSDRQRLIIALINLTYPTWQVSVELIYAPYPFCYCLFFLGWYLTIKNVHIKGIAHLFLRLLSYTIFLISFTIQSLLVFYYGIFAIFFIVSKNRSHIDLKQGIKRKVWHYFDYLSLPVLFWMITNIFFAPQGLYQGYYTPDFSPIAIIDIYLNFLTVAVYGQIFHYLKLLFVSSFVGPFILSISLFLFLFYRLPFDILEDYSTKYFPLKIMFGFGLLLMGIFPYAAVGLYVTPYGWSSRHALLIALPVGLLVVVCFDFIVIQTCKIFQVLIPSISYSKQIIIISKLETALLLVLVIACTLSTLSVYFTWQARWIKDRSIMTKLSTMPIAKKTSMFIVYDYFLIGSEPYRYYEWASLFKQVWGTESRIGVDFRHSPESYLKNYKDYQSAKFNLKDFDPDGCQAKMLIHPGTDLAVNNIRNYVELTIRYFYFKYFKESELRRFLTKVTNIELNPITSADTCREL